MDKNPKHPLKKKQIKQKVVAANVAETQETESNHKTKKHYN